MLSKSTTGIINLLEQDNGEHNTLQRVMLEFLKRELLKGDLLSVSVETSSAGDYYSNDQKVTVKLKLGKEVISEDYFTYTPGERPSNY